MKKTDIVYCAVTNSVLYAGDALFGADGKAYRVECAPKGATAGVFDADDEPAGEPTDLISVAVDVAPGDDADGDAEASAVELEDDGADADDEPAGEDDFEPAGHGDHVERADRRHNRNRGR